MTEPDPPLRPTASRPLLRRPAVWLLLLLPVHALVLALLPAAWVEALFGRVWFPLVARLHAALDATVVSPGVTLGALLVGATLGSAVRAARAAPRFGPGLAKAWAWRLVIVVAALAHAFSASWGLNYRRPSVRERLGLPKGPFEQAAFTRSADRVIRATNAARVPWGEPDVEALERAVDAAMQSALRDLGLAEAAVPGRRARLLPRGLMAVGGWGGVTLPWTTEAMVDPAVDPRFLPHLFAHEKAHQVGIAREQDANFVAWLALVRAEDPRLRYSTLFYMADVFQPHATVDLEPDVLADAREAAARQRAVQVEAVKDVTQQAYDAYLKANDVQAGLVDYGLAAESIHAWLEAHPDLLP